MTDQTEYYTICHGTGTLAGQTSIIAPDGFECFHFPGIVTRLNEQRAQIEELQAEIRRLKEPDPIDSWVRP